MLMRAALAQTVHGPHTSRFDTDTCCSGAHRLQSSRLTALPGLQGRQGAFWPWTGRMAARQARCPEDPSNFTSSWPRRWGQTAATGLCLPCPFRLPVRMVGPSAAPNLRRHAGCLRQATTLPPNCLATAESTDSCAAAWARLLQTPFCAFVRLRATQLTVASPAPPRLAAVQKVNHGVTAHSSARALDTLHMQASAAGEAVGAQSGWMATCLGCG